MEGVEATGAHATRVAERRGNVVPPLRVSTHSSRLEWEHHGNADDSRARMSAVMRSASRHASQARDLRWVRRTAWVAAVVIGFVPMFALSYVAEAVRQIVAKDVSAQRGEDRPEGPPDNAKGQWVNILLMGSDARDGENGQIGGHVGGMRNDTTILMHVSADRTRVQFMSIPRDLRVPIPNCTLSDGTVVKGWTGKFNIAFANGGSKGDPFDAAVCTMNAVEAITDIYVQHFVVVDFAGFKDMIDALEGVPMCIPGRIYAPKAKLNLEGGPQLLDGYEALAWARLRTTTIGKEFVNGSDLQRIERQQELLSHMIEKALSKDTLTDFDKFTDFVEAGAASLKMDIQLKDQLIALLWSLRDIKPENITFTTVPNEYTEDFSDVVQTADAKTMFEAIKADQPISGKSVTDSSNAGSTPTPGASTGDDDDPLALVSECPVTS